MNSDDAPVEDDPVDDEFLDEPPVPDPGVCLALASAFLAGEWDPPAMGRRGKRVLGDRRHWITDLARTVRHRFPEKPSDRPREVARFIAACPQIIEMADDPRRPLRVARWIAAPVEMVAARFPVPIIHDVPALAGWLGVSVDHLEWFADRWSWEAGVRDERLRHYHRAWVRKPDGSGRLLEAPKRELKDLQRMVLHGILDRIPAHPAAHGFTPDRSALTGARVHAGREAVLRLDLESFFTAVSAGRVYGIFRTAGYPEPVAHRLAGLCTTTTPAPVRRQAPPAPSADAVGRRRRMLDALAIAHLPQGSPTSPSLANLAALRLDRRLAGLAAHFGAAYTRYADDLTMSGSRTLLNRAGLIVRLVEGIAAEEGFRLNDAKTRVRSHAQRQLVTGLVVNEGPRLPRNEYDRLRAVLHDAVAHGPQAANRQGHPDFRAHLQGRIAWAATTPARAEKLRRTFAAIRW